MLRFAVWRFLLALPSLLGLLVLVFVLVRVLPTDPAVTIAGDTATPQQVEEIRHRYGFDQPLPQQFWRYLGQIAHADLGTSLFTSRPVVDDLTERLPATLTITLTALVLAIGVGVPLGAWAAAEHNRPVDVVVRFLTVGGLAVASFWFAILLQLGFSMDLDLLPLSGEIDAAVRPPPTVTGFLVLDCLVAGRWDALWDALTHLVLPAVTLAMAPTATIARFVRSGMLETLQKDYIAYADAMGYPRLVLLAVYALRNSVVAAVTQIGLLFGALMGGAVAVEQIFDWPGIGHYAVRAVLSADYNAVLAVTLLMGVVYAVVNVLVDLTHALLDPRVAEQM